MKTLLAVALGVVVGILTLAAFRTVAAGPAEPTHYHANFALFVDGERVDLSADEYMEDVATCAHGGTVLPAARAHLHNNDPDVAHVHHEGVTWGHLLANLGYGLGADYLALHRGPVLTETGGSTLKFVLNGQPQLAVHDQLIQSGDRLLISYGPESEPEVLRAQFPRVAVNAEEFNQRPDPASCAGAHQAGLLERLRYAFVG